MWQKHPNKCKNSIFYTFKHFIFFTPRVTGNKKNWDRNKNTELKCKRNWATCGKSRRRETSTANRRVNQDNNVWNNTLIFASMSDAIVVFDPMVFLWSKVHWARSACLATTSSHPLSNCNYVLCCDVLWCVVLWCVVLCCVISFLFMSCWVSYCMWCVFLSPSWCYSLQQLI